VYARLGERYGLWSADGPSLLVGASALGTAELLQAGAASLHAPAEERFAFVIDLAGSAEPAPRFWALLAAALAEAGVVTVEPTAENDVARQLQTWLADGPHRRVWILVDGADALVDNHHAQPLADLMRASQGQLKLVLAGGLELLRAARTSGHALAAHGYAVLRPLLDDGAWRDAAGVLQSQLPSARPESAAVVAGALGLANYQPGTLERFGQLLERRFGGRTLGLADLDQLATSHDGAAVLTAALREASRADAWHEAIVCLLALWCWAPVGDDPDGAARDWLRGQMLALALSSESAFDGVLDELLALDVVHAVAADRFILATPNLAALLGTEEELLATLLDVAARQPAADAA
jgi:hypothetical protein